MKTMNKKILIIEDDQSIAELERDYLEIEGFQVEIAQEGKSGLDAALNRNFDLILLDLMIPNINGFDICKQVRKVSNVPIIMVTAKFEDIDKVRGLGLGADDYIVKPFSPRELVARVKAHIARYERLIQVDIPKDEIHIKGIHINIAARQVFLDGKEVLFTTKEFDLLSFFAMHPNQVFSKEELFEKIWGFDSMGDNATVTVHVKKIRKKIEKDTSNPEYIQTMWGSGYRFNG
ncbi:response regulator transcription factor [Bacillus sp. FJAT-49711]|uniref:response regulator transcription factor n=1 Tax=Bacillus sp. FJAT-49711 TaxID=2833585 RepID=UPI001BCA5BA3|nr:response regulator transcription factor [Bacillus sp. FJAT-49711]MBS4219947.1 response regulator transcription factor [Bacillus sp. FJAT-49711]